MMAAILYLWRHHGFSVAEIFGAMANFDPYLNVNLCTKFGISIYLSCTYESILYPFPIPDSATRDTQATYIWWTKIGNEFEWFCTFSIFFSFRRIYRTKYFCTWIIGVKVHPEVQDNNSGL